MGGFVCKPGQRLRNRRRLLTVMVLGLAFGGARAELAAVGDARAGPPPPARQDELVRSPGVAEIVRLVHAQMNTSVIKTYIENSPIAYSPTAREIVSLKKHGMPEDLISAMLRRGAALKKAAAARASALSRISRPPAANSGPDDAFAR